MNSGSNSYTLFTEVKSYYSQLLHTLKSASHSISMLYLTYDQGEWADQINQVLVERHTAGVNIRVMTDFLGTLTDHPRNLLNNLKMMRFLKDEGLDIGYFNPRGPRMTYFDRLHIKMCAVDDHLMFVGGSNIGDYYTSWQDTNFLVNGDLGGVGHAIYDFIASNSKGPSSSPILKEKLLNLSEAKCGDAKLFLTVPGARRDICRNIIDLVLKAKKAVHFRYWYFLPNPELLNAILSQLENGVAINIMLSHRTRVPLLDLVSRVMLIRLVRAGASVYRYKKCYMHSKVIWTDSGDVMIGSANIEFRAMQNNFEMCLRFKNPGLADQLSNSFFVDLGKCQSV